MHIKNIKWLYLAICFIALSAIGNAELYQVYLPNVSQATLDVINEWGFDFWGSSESGIVGAADSDLLTLMKINGIHFSITKALPEGRHPYAFKKDNQYIHYSGMVSALNALTAQYPQKVKLYDLGASLENRRIYAVKISDQVKEADDPTKPDFVLFGCHHAREWLTVNIPIMAAQELASSTNQSINEWLKRCEIWIVPMVNPDGHEYSVSYNQWWRKNRRYNGSGYYGVDLNRNYGYMWGGAGSSSNISSDTYRGTAPFSEPETQVVRDFMLSNKLSDIAVVYSMHTYSQLMLYPWGYTTAAPPDNGAMAAMAAAMTTLIYQVNNRNYIPQQSVALYTTSGDTSDWVLGAVNAPCFTVEMRPDSSGGGYSNPFIPSASEIQPAYDENMPAIKYLIEYTADVNRVGRTNLISRSSANALGNNNTNSAAIGANTAVFASAADNLVDNDFNGAQDIFVRKLDTAETVLASVKSDGTIGNGASQSPSITPNGRFVVFSSVANNLADEDANDVADIFIKDMVSGALELVSIGVNGESANGASDYPCATPDGRFVVFASYASNLVVGDANDKADIFIRDRWMKTTRLVSVLPNNVQANNHSFAPSAVSWDGALAAFETTASNFHANDLNGAEDVYLKNLATGSVTLISKTTSNSAGNGASGKPAMSADGRYVAFHSSASNLVSGDSNGVSDVFLHDVLSNSMLLVSQSLTGAKGNGASTLPALSADGRMLAYQTAATNIVTDANGKNDVLVVDLDADKDGNLFELTAGSSTIMRASVSPITIEGNNHSNTPSLDLDGMRAAFISSATKLVPNDLNGMQDAFTQRLFSVRPIFTGSVIFNDWNGAQIALLDAQYRFAGQTAPFDYATIPLNNGYSYSASSYRMKLSISIKPRSFLRQTLIVDTRFSNAENIQFSFINGDAMNDNRIDDFDLYALMNELGESQSNPNVYTDLNGDGMVNEIDLAVACASLGLIGDE